MAEQVQYSALTTSEHKRRRVEVEPFNGVYVKAERGKGVVTDKAKANYLSSQLRLRLQYAKLKVEHGWQRQTLSEVENLYFRHTHLTRPYPVISPGGRRNGRTLSSDGFASSSTQQENVPSALSARCEQSLDGAAAQTVASTSAGARSSLRSNGVLSGSSLSSSSIGTAATLSMPSTPTCDTSRIGTPLAPHVGSGSSLTRYPITRSDSASTVIIESTPSLYQTSHLASNSKASQPIPASPSMLSGAHQSPSAIPAGTFREPFDPMEPTEHLDSQLAVLRSIISASSMPIPLPPPTPTPVQGPSPSSSSSGRGMTYDSFWSAHGSATASHRSVLTGQAMPAARTTPAPSLQANASVPVVLGPSGLMNANEATQHVYGAGRLG